MYVPARVGDAYAQDYLNSSLAAATGRMPKMRSSLMMNGMNTTVSQDVNLGSAMDNYVVSCYN